MLPGYVVGLCNWAVWLSYTSYAFSLQSFPDSRTTQAFAWTHSTCKRHQLNFCNRASVDLPTQLTFQSGTRSASEKYLQALTGPGCASKQGPFKTFITNRNQVPEQFRTFIESVGSGCKVSWTRKLHACAVRRSVKLCLYYELGAESPNLLVATWKDLSNWWTE